MGAAMIWVRDEESGLSGWRDATDLGNEEGWNGGGSSAPTDRARYESANSASDNDLVEWNPTPNEQHGRDLLDFTDPTVPTALVAGVYSVSCWFQGAPQAGKQLRIDLELDANGDDATYETGGTLDGFGSQNPTFSVSGAWFMDVGATMYAAINHDVGIAYGLYRLYVQLVSEATT